ncbi:hypothetical protein HD806DRAFT_390283 [Xylariaceae sp. AK1471]|nr:hypothetical protein HD806DRAFT_390283 [Xylariaceae sp. AK1471]
MVSFFGLKIGGEKKKKPTKGLQISAPQPQDLDNSNALDSDFFDFEGGPKASYEASVYSLSRQETAQSTMSRKGKLRGLKIPPFGSNKYSSSLVDLPTPPSLRHHASNPSLGRRWNTDSVTSLSLAPPPGFHPMARPSTSDNKSKKWVDPLDIHFTPDLSKSGSNPPLSVSLNSQNGGSLSAPSSAAPRSPLGQYELKLDLPSDVSTFADFGNFTEAAQAPPPLRIKKQASTRVLVEPQMKSQSPQKPPSPPQSIDDREVTESPVPEPPKLQTAEARRLSGNSHRSIPSGLQELQNAISNFGPTSLPSPSTTPRASEEELSTTAISPRSAPLPTENGEAQPIIQNVRAKRDTLTVNPQRRRSLQMKIEAAEGGNLGNPTNLPWILPVERPKTSNSGRPFERPPQLNLNTGFRLSAADRNGPRSAPFLPNPTRSLTPTSVNSPLRSQIEVQGPSSLLALGNQTYDRRSRLDSPTGSSIYNDDEFDFPPSPESPGPLIPLTGPLASPRFPPSSQSPLPHSNTFTFPPKGKRDSAPAPPIPPRSLRRNPPTPDSACWPLPSPIVTSFDRAAISPSPADSRLRLESESESLSAYEPLEPPRIPAARSGAESPTFRSFSRPWTPTATISEFKEASLRRAETARPLASSVTEGEIGGGLRPPPRSTTVRTLSTEIGSVKSVTAQARDSGFI